MKKKKLMPFPEMALNPSDRRKRARLMASISIGSNALTARQIRRLPSRPIPSKRSARQEKRLLKRYARAGYSL